MRLLHKPARLFAGWSFARRFLVLYAALLTAATIGIGLWVGRQLEAGIVDRTAAVTALYIDSFVEPHVQSLAASPQLSSADTKALGDVLSGTRLGDDIVSFKIWSRDGEILYSPTAGLVGQRFEIDSDLARSYNGEITADLTNLTDEENAFERLHWSRLLQMYVPVRETGSGRIIAVAEFYQLPDAIDAEVANARLRSWLAVLAAAVLSYLGVAVIVKRASDTILRQQARLRNQVWELSALLHQVDTLNSRLRHAAGQAVEITTQERRRISADLHDGPAQAMALGLLQLEAIQAEGDPDRPSGRLAAAYSAISGAMTELREIAAGLRLPDLATLSIHDVAARAVDDHRRRSGIQVTADLEDVADDAPLAAKIALFRGLQEALSNATRHGRAADVRVRVSVGPSPDAVLHLEVSDAGPGFVPADAAQTRGLGLAGMRERAALLGGSFEIAGRPEGGTVVRMSLPLAAPGVSSAAGAGGGALSTAATGTAAGVLAEPAAASGRVS